MVEDTPASNPSSHRGKVVFHEMAPCLPVRRQTNELETLDNDHMVEADSPRSRWAVAALLLCLTIYGAGVVFRFAYIFHWHPPNDPQYIYSDMSGYVGNAVAWFQPGYKFHPVDTVMPPGYHWLLGSLFYLDPSRKLAVIVQFLMSCAVPLMVAGMAYQMYGRSVASLSLVLVSIYFPFVDYAGYFLTESPFLFTMVLSMLLLVSAIRVRWGWLSQILALLAGITLAAAVLIKPALLLIGGLVFLSLAQAAWKHRWSRLGLVMLTSVTGLVLVMAPTSLRATRINGGGSFILVSTGGPINFLQGHGGENVGGVTFVDPKTGARWGWGSPATAQKAAEYRAAMAAEGRPFDQERFNVILHFNFPPWDKENLSKASWQRLRDAPWDCFTQSCTNVVETFFTSQPWPTAAWTNTPWYHCCVWSQRFFAYLILLPATLHIIMRRRLLREQQGAGLADGLMALPVLGVMLVTFLVIPEARYRIPYDVFALMLAARFYTLGAARPDGLVPPPKPAPVAA